MVQRLSIIAIAQILVISKLSAQGKDGMTTAKGFPHPFKYFLFIAKSYLLIRIFSIYCERLSKGPAFLTIPPAPHFLTGKPKTKKYDAAAPA